MDIVWKWVADDLADLRATVPHEVQIWLIILTLGAVATLLARRYFPPLRARLLEEQRKKKEEEDRNRAILTSLKSIGPALELAVVRVTDPNGDDLLNLYSLHEYLFK